MSSKSKPNPLVYTDTNTFEYTPKYTYPTHILNRFLFFWGLSKNWKATINLAMKFMKPNNICVAFIVGDVKEEQVRKYIADVDLHLMVVWSDCVQKYVEEYKYLKDVLGKLKTTGYTEETLTDEIRKFEAVGLENFEEAFGDMYERDKEYIRVLHREPQMISEFQTDWGDSLHSIGCYEGKISGKQDEISNDLFEIAKTVFPYGIEAASPSVLAYKTVREKICQAGMDNKSQFDFYPSKADKEISSEILMYAKEDTELSNPLAVFKSREEAIEKTGVDDNAIWRCCAGRTSSVKYKDGRVTFRERFSPDSIPYMIVQKLRELQHDLIWNKGGFYINDLKHLIAAPPYGYYECNWYAYLLCVALNALIDEKHKTLAGVAVGDISAETLVFGATMDMSGYSGTRKYRYFVKVFKHNDKQTKTVDMLRRMFGIKERTISIQDTLLKVHEWLQNNVRIGCVDVVFPELYKVIRYNFDQYAEHGYEDELYDVLKSRYKELKRDVQNIDKITEKLIVDKYGQEWFDKYKWYVETHYEVSRHARSWIWDVGIIFDEVEFVNTHYQCIECEKTIHNAEQAELPNGKYIMFSEKEIIGINRKLIDDTGKKCYCIKCMCDICDCTAQDIKDKIEQFKEDGCTLFQ